MSLTTTKELLEVHNHLAEGLGRPVLKSWTKSKAKLQERIDALQAEGKAAKPAPTKTARKASKGGSVKAFIDDRILAGEDDATILAACREHFPKLDWDGSRRTYPRWYRNHMDRQAKKKAATR